jgi:hypothetical protein
MYGIEKRVGKRVWLFENVSGWCTRLVKDKVWTVESVHEPDGKEFYEDYFTVSNGDEKRDVIYYDTVVLPEDNKDEQYRIEKYLADNGFYFDDISVEEIVGVPLYRISISWGDWKHDHGWLDNLMSYMGYEAFNEIVTEENGSDCYSSDHIFVSQDCPKLKLLHELQEIFSD